MAFTDGNMKIKGLLLYRCREPSVAPRGAPYEPEKEAVPLSENRLFEKRINLHQLA